MNDREQALAEAGKRILAEPDGCRFCDSGKLRTPNDPAKDHDDGCGFAMMATALRLPSNETASA
jgi:hypothetical protein